MNNFWIMIVMLFSIYLLPSNIVEANDTLIDARIYQGITTDRRLNVAGLQSSYAWEFENKLYTALIVVDEQWYNSVRNKKKSRRYDPEQLPSKVYEGSRTLQKLINEFKSVMPKDWRSEKKVNFVLAFVQSIPWTDDKTTGYDEFYKYPIETLAEVKGDCEDTSILFASLLNGLGFKVALFDLPRHIAVGVKGDFRVRGFYVPYKDDKYYYCETTSTRYKLGMMPERYEDVTVRIMPITPKPVEPGQVIPQTVPPVPKLPSPPSAQKAFENGRQLYYDARYNEAIKSLQFALSDLEDPEQRAEVYVYLGIAEYAFEKGSTSEAEAIGKARFRDALRQNPDTELDNPKFTKLFEEVRSESIGELTVSVSPPQAEIWISGNGIDRKNLGTGIKPINLRLFKGSYTVEGVYAERSEEQTIDIRPNTHEELEIRIPVDDQPPEIEVVDPMSTAAVNQRIRVKAKVTDDSDVKSVYLFYHFSRSGTSGTEPSEYDRIALKKTALDIYAGHMPPQSKTGYIWYYLTATDTEGNEGDTKKREIEIKPVHLEPPPDHQLLTIEVLSPPEVADVDQRIPVKARVVGSIGVKSVYLFYHFSRFGTEPSEYDRIALKKTALGIYTGDIPSQSETGYVLYYLTTDREGNNPESDTFRIRIKRDRPVPPPEKPSPPIAHQGIWANYAWSSGVFENGAPLFNWNRGDLISLTYLREGKRHQTFGVQLEYSDPNSSNMGLTFQWAPALEGSPIVFTLPWRCCKL